MRDPGTPRSTPADGAARIVSLTPELTDTLFALGLGPQMVGCARWQTMPGDGMRPLSQVGDPQHVDLVGLRALAPTHVLVNRDENPEAVVDAVRAIVPHVVVTDPRTPDDNFALYTLLGDLFDRRAEAATLDADLRSAREAVARVAWPARQVIYCRWQDPWMTVSRDTYIARTLALVNWHTWPASDADLQACHGGHCARPSAPGSRYPAFRWQDEVVRATDLILLSSAPYRFTEEHADALERQTGTPVACIDAQIVAYGSGAASGVRALAALAHEWG